MCGFFAAANQKDTLTFLRLFLFLHKQRSIFRTFINVSAFYCLADTTQVWHKPICIITKSVQVLD